MFNFFTKKNFPVNKLEEVKEQIKEKTIKEKFNEYCELNPDADECREYDV
jgi:CP12 domain